VKFFERLFDPARKKKVKRKKKIKGLKKKNLYALSSPINHTKKKKKPK